MYKRRTHNTCRCFFFFRQQQQQQLQLLATHIVGGKKQQKSRRNVPPIIDLCAFRMQFTHYISTEILIFSFFEG